ncbi:MAG: zinc ABC transporter substrate-binding protein [Elusimicrobia bacterium]|nr:zinc ABC transporter substrate-binding protein [Elusimicrobiota bacterium]
MKRILQWVWVALVGLVVGLGQARATGPLKVFATTPDLADLVRQVGGDQVKVESLARGFQDPHFVEAKPSLIVKLMDADVFVQTGLDLEVGWAPLLIQSARNPRIQTGGAGFIDVSQFVAPLDVPTNPTRAEGDIHPGGNPHFLTDPENARMVARGIAEKLSSLRPADASTFKANAAAFEKKLDDKMKTWTASLAPYAGATFISYHKNLPYFAKRFGLVSVGEIEPKPGIPPSGGHTAELEAAMKAKKTRLILTQPYFEKRTPDSIARDTGATVVVFAMAPEAVPEATDYLSTMDSNVNGIVKVLSVP